jgi:uncharacterized protein YjiS (DUF1127 family)
MRWKWAMILATAACAEAEKPASLRSAAVQAGAPDGRIRAWRGGLVISRPLRFRGFAWKRLWRRLLRVAQAWRRPGERDASPAISDHLLRDIGISRLEAAFMEFRSLPGAPPPDLGYAPRTSFSAAEQPVHKLDIPPSPVASRNRPAPETRLIVQIHPSH